MRNRIHHASANRHLALRRLYSLQEFSLARYAAGASLYGKGGAKESLQLIRDIASGQQARASEVGSLIAQRRETAPSDMFPLSFTRMNYAAADFVARRLLAKQPELLAAISQCAIGLSDDAEGQSLAEQILDAERENLRKLRRVVAPVTGVANQWAEAA